MTQPPPPPSDEPVWHYLVGQQRLGPVPMQTLLAMIESGAIQPTTLVWRQGMAAWVAAGAAAEFAFAFSRRATLASSLNEIATSKKEVALGLTTAGLVVFILLLFVCVPLCWLPWVIDGLRAKP